ncbi:MAG: type VI secretion system-associated protein TagF [Aliidongia sp.]
MAIGFYGKLPMRGDFLGRSLAQDFVQPWDEWLQGVLQTAHDGLEQAWLGYYLNSPIWHYVLGAGLCGPAAMAGVMIASVDSVGRYFPLTVAVPLPGQPAPALVAPALSDWCKAAEAVALRALEADIPFAEFEGAVAALALPREVSGEVGFGPVVTVLEAELVPALLRLSLDPAACRSSLWWTDGTPELPAVALRTDGMPSAQQAVALFDGQWERWGWIRR